VINFFPKNDRSCSDTLHALNFFSRIWCDTLSKAFLKSTNKTPTTLPESIAFLYFSVRSSNTSSVDLEGLNPIDAHFAGYALLDEWLTGNRRGVQVFY